MFDNMYNLNIRKGEAFWWFRKKNNEQSLGRSQLLSL